MFSQATLALTPAEQRSTLPGAALKRISLLECAHTKNVSATPLESALSHSLQFKPFGIRTYVKMGGGGYSSSPFAVVIARGETRAGITCYWPEAGTRNSAARARRMDGSGEAVSARAIGFMLFMLAQRNSRGKKLRPTNLT